MASIRRLLCLALVALVVVPVPQAAAQEGLAEIELLAQPVWHGAADNLNIKLRISNVSDSELAGFNVVIGSSYRVTTRSDLQRIFDPAAFESVSSLPLPLAFPDLTLAPDESREIVVRNPVSDLALISAGEPGVYPVKITLQDSAGVSLDSIATQVLFYPDRPDTRLGIVPLIVLNESPARSPDGTFAPDVEGGYPLEEAVADDGWLSVAVNALVDHGFRGGFAPTPRLLEELDDMANGYHRISGDSVQRVTADSPPARRADELLARLRTGLESRALQPVNVPYSAPDLPAIAPLNDAIADQLAVGSAAFAEVLGEDTGAGRAWAYGPSGRLDAEALEQISGAGVEHTFFSAVSLEPPPDPEAAGCPEPAYSFACPVEVATEFGGSLTGYGLDPFIQDHLGEMERSGSPAVALQRFFAETAMIREELPGTPDRVIAAALPIESSTSAVSSKLITAVARAPWLETVSPSEGLTVADPIRKEIVPSLPNPSEAPAESYFEMTQAASETVAQFGSVQPPVDLHRRLGRNVLVAQSRELWTDLPRGASYARESVDEVESELQQIRVVGPDQITLTSKRGEFQFIVVNDTGYDVTVDVALISQDLNLPDSGLREVPPGQNAVTVDVITEASGIFPLTVQLRTPDGLEISEAKPITVRSTEFNEIALAITFGALAFVIIFYFVRGMRRKRNRREPRAGASAA